MQDNESPEKILVREVEEELCVLLREYEFLLVRQTPNMWFHLFVLEVPDYWEALVTVREGDYGRFYTEEEIRAEALMTPLIREMLITLFSLLHPPS